MHVAFEDIKAGNTSPEAAMIRTQIYLTKQVKEAIERLSDERRVGAKVKPIEIRMIVNTNILIDSLKGSRKPSFFLSYIPTKILIFKS